jgi:hypothetical protein
MSPPLSTCIHNEAHKPIAPTRLHCPLTTQTGSIWYDWAGSPSSHRAGIARHGVVRRDRTERWVAERAIAIYAMDERGVGCTNEDPIEAGRAMLAYRNGPG